MLKTHRDELDASKALAAAESISEEALEQAKEHGDAYLAAYYYYSDAAAALEACSHAYEGMHESLEDWAYEYWESAGMLSDVPEHARNYIDFAAWARDCELSGDIAAIECAYKEVHVFYNHW